MAGISVHTNLNGANVHSSLIGRSKGSAGPRKALAELQNVQQSKSVTFEKPAIGSKSTIKPLSQHGKIKFSTPGGKGIRINTPGNRSTVRNKTPFKIHKDAEVVTKGQVESVTQHNNDVAEEKEYMPPNTDKDFEIPMPAYLDTVLNAKPIYTVDLTPEIKEFDPELLTDAFTAEFLKRNKDIQTLNEDDTALYDITTNISEEDLLYELENDDSFSLEVLDRELRAAGLEMPQWQE